MAHHHLLPLILALSILLILLPSSSHAATKALFSEPLQFLLGGQSLTDGDLTLSLSNNCSLILYKAGSPVLDFGTSAAAALNCVLFLNKYGQLRLVADDEVAPTQTIGKKAYPGRYVLLLTHGKLGIFGPGMWDNGVKFTTFSNYINYQPTLNNHEKLKTGSTDCILFSGDIANGSANGDVVIAETGRVSAVITEHCTLSVKDDTTDKIIWETSPNSAEPTECSLELKSNGDLLLQRHNESGVVTQWKGGYAAQEDLYVCLLRSYGQIVIYGLQTWLYDGSSSSSSSSSSSAIASVVAVADEDIEMVRA